MGAPLEACCDAECSRRPHRLPRGPDPAADRALALAAAGEQPVLAGALRERVLADEGAAAGRQRDPRRAAARAELLGHHADALDADGADAAIHGTAGDAPRLRHQRRAQAHADGHVALSAGANHVRLHAAHALRLPRLQERHLVLEEQQVDARPLPLDDAHEPLLPDGHLPLPVRQRHVVDDPHVQRRGPGHRGLEAAQGGQVGRRACAAGRALPAAEDNADRLVRALRHQAARRGGDALPLARHVPARRRVLPLFARDGDAQVVLLVAPRLDCRLRVHVWLCDDDATAVHQLQAQVDRTHAVEDIHVQVTQHLRRRPLRFHHRDAHDAPALVLARRCRLLGLLVPALGVRRGQEACK
mmetsp:Transcript_31854/g.83243  ORF Transcript_31854/g.83243 Transcript_31854/m.83243 type:complete len:358 (-) Transcript_31854:287-1360(-)